MTEVWLVGPLGWESDTGHMVLSQALPTSSKIFSFEAERAKGAGGGKVTAVILRHVPMAKQPLRSRFYGLQAPGWEIGNRWRHATGSLPSLR